MVYRDGFVHYATFKLLLLKNIFLIVFCCTVPGNIDAETSQVLTNVGNKFFFFFVPRSVHSELSLIYFWTCLCPWKYRSFVGFDLPSLHSCRHLWEICNCFFTSCPEHASWWRFYWRRGPGSHPTCLSPISNEIVMQVSPFAIST